MVVIFKIEKICHCSKASIIYLTRSHVLTLNGSLVTFAINKPTQAYQYRAGRHVVIYVTVIVYRTIAHPLNAFRNTRQCKRSQARKHAHTVGLMYDNIILSVVKLKKDKKNWLFKSIK